MKITSYTEVEKYFSAGDEVWACAYEYDRTNFGKHYFQEPVLGIFSAGNTACSHDRYLSEGRVTPRYFVPYKKNSKEPAWSKCVSIYARCYTNNKEECVSLFNELILGNIEWHENEIKKLKDALFEEEWERE